MKLVQMLIVRAEQLEFFATPGRFWLPRFTGA